MTHPSRGLPAPSVALAAALVVALLTAVLVGGRATAGAADPDHRPVTSGVLAETREALARSGRQDTTMALTRLRLAYPHLTPRERAAADALLARPTDGAADPEQFGYTVAEATPVCGVHVCVHYVPSSADAPAPTDADLDGVPDWVRTTLATLESVFGFYTLTLGYRPPPTDGSRGGSGLFDVYLSQIGDDGLYGFCAPEETVPGETYAYSGYCVLDQDFAEFPLGALPSMQVTAAHEFFHAVQFGYDATEDRWLMEATAVWAEERYADDVDDNRQYLRYGQLGRPRIPLDEFDPFGQSAYGNWLFFELLSKKYGVDVVRRVWNQADATQGAPDRYSTAAVRKVLERLDTTFPAFYARFATVNQLPARFYKEGSSYRNAPVARAVRLTRSRRTIGDGKRLDHLTSAAYRLKPAGSLRGAWRLRVAVVAPPTARGSTASLLVRQRDGRASVRSVTLRRDGTGRKTIALGRGGVRSVTLVLANASTRFAPCWQGTSYSCQGVPKDDQDSYEFTATLVR